MFGPKHKQTYHVPWIALTPHTSVYKYYIYRNNATYTATCMSVHPDKTSIYRTGNNRDSDTTIYGRDPSLRRTKHGQSYRLQQHCLTDPHRWPIYRQSFLQNPSHWWPGTCTGPGPPPWFDQYGGSHVRLISQYLRMVEDGFSPQDAAKATRMHVCAIDFFFFTWSIWQSTFILIPCYGGGWDAFSGTAKNQRAAHVDDAIGQIMKQHRRLQNWKAKHTHRERNKKNFSSVSVCAIFFFVNTSWWWIGDEFKN